MTPYEICVNPQTGETTSRALVSSSPIASSGSAPIIFGKANVGVSSGMTSGSTFSESRLGSLGNLNSGMFAASGGTTSGLTSSESRLGSLGNLNSGMFAAPRSGTYGNLNSGSVGFSRPSSGVYNLPRLLYAAAGSNAAMGQTQYSELTRSGSFSDCEDDTDGIREDSYPEVPADAVSLTLAYQNLRAPNVIYRQGKQFVPEDKLSFGHRTVQTRRNTRRNLPTSQKKSS